MFPLFTLLYYKLLKSQCVFIFDIINSEIRERTTHMNAHRQFVLSLIAITSLSIILSLIHTDSWVTVSNRLFLLGIALLVSAALIFLFSSDFGFVVVRGMRLLFKDKPLQKPPLPKTGTHKRMGFILTLFTAGVVDVILSVLMIMLLY